MAMPGHALRQNTATREKVKKRCSMVFVKRTDPQAKATMAVKEVQLFKEQRWIYAMKCTYELPRSFFLRKNDKRFATSFIRRITRKIRPSLFFFHRNQAKKTTRSTRVQPLSA
jgi:hypothetical protein